MARINAQKLKNYVSGSKAVIQDKRTNEEIFNYDLEFKKNFLTTRKWVGVLTFSFVWLWLIVMLWFILAQGLGRLPLTSVLFHLSESTLITLITTTTITVVTFLTIVIKNLFPKNNY